MSEKLLTRAQAIFSKLTRLNQPHKGVNYARFAAADSEARARDMFKLGQRFKAIFLLRCPKCLRGKVFSGMVTMNECCPLCGHKFEREPGYFMGAMFGNYFLAIPFIVLLT